MACSSVAVMEDSNGVLAAADLGALWLRRIWQWRQLRRRYWRRQTRGGSGSGRSLIACIIGSSALCCWWLHRVIRGCSMSCHWMTQRAGSGRDQSYWQLHSFVSGSASCRWPLHPVVRGCAASLSALHHVIEGCITSCCWMPLWFWQLCIVLMAAASCH